MELRIPARAGKPGGRLAVDELPAAPPVDHAVRVEENHMQLSVIVPVYNEAATVAEVVARLQC